jgi:ankyrin repeat protein
VKIEVLGALIKAGADVDLQTSSGKTALICAVKCPRFCYEALEMLIAAGANLNVRMNDGVEYRVAGGTF